jgi:hypothetical protein
MKRLGWRIGGYSAILVIILALVFNFSAPANPVGAVWT